MNRLLPAALFAAVLAAPLAAQERTLTVTVTPGKQAGKNVPVVVPLSLPADWKEGLSTVSLPDGKVLFGQLTVPGLATEPLSPSAPNLVRRDLHFIAPQLEPGKPLVAKVALGVKSPTLADIEKAEVFKWDEKPGEYSELSIGAGASRRPVLRYVSRKFDDSSKEARDKSYKVFHHLYDPDGKRFVTNGGQLNENVSDPKKLVFPHHRGLMYAFNKITYGPDFKKKADTWHATGDAHQSHRNTKVSESGPVLGRHRAEVDWHGEKKEVFAAEQREVTVYNVPGGTLVEFVSKLTPTTGPVKLDGDPQHAGFQFRAHNEVAAQTAKQTYYLRPDGKGSPGETRNWDPKTKKGPVDLPWYAMSFVLDGQRYTVEYLNHPTNPKETRFSERDYGRFGGYFEHELTDRNPLIVQYRIWLQEGEMSADQARALHAAFADRPTAVAK